MTRTEIREILGGLGIYFDPEHPDHISREKIETLEAPFMEWGTETQAFFADNCDYYNWERLTIYLYTDENEDAEVLASDGRLFEDALREAFGQVKIEKNYNDELNLYQTRYTMDV